MREVGVHLHHPLPAVGLAQRALKRGQVGSAQALLPGAVHDPDVRIGGRDLIREHAGTVGGAVIHDQQRRLGTAARTAGTIAGKHSLSL